MSEGFGGFVDKTKIESDGKAKVIVNDDEIEKLLKSYKKIKKYQKSSLFAVKQMDGTEKVISKMIQEVEDNPL